MSEITAPMGGKVLEADFIGRKHITGRTEPLNFIGFSFKKEPKLRYFKRVSGETADEFIRQAGNFFEKFEKPDYVKVDNCAATIGSISNKRNISRAMGFLLSKQVIPIFAVPRKPFSQASMEGNNSVFSKKFWNTIEFGSVQEVDEKLEWFNQSSLDYTEYEIPTKHREMKKDFEPKVYFIRQVKEDNEKAKGGQQAGKGMISVLNEEIHLPESYINYFVLAEWNLNKEVLYVRFEKERQSELIAETEFRINAESKKRYNNLFC